MEIELAAKQSSDYFRREEIFNQNAIPANPHHGAFSRRSTNPPLHSNGRKHIPLPLPGAATRVGISSRPAHSAEGCNKSTRASGAESASPQKRKRRHSARLWVPRIEAAVRARGGEASLSEIIETIKGLFPQEISLVVDTNWHNAVRVQLYRRKQSRFAKVGGRSDARWRLAATLAATAREQGGAAVEELQEQEVEGDGESESGDGGSDSCAEESSPRMPTKRRRRSTSSSHDGDVRSSATLRGGESCGAMDLVGEAGCGGVGVGGSSGGRLTWAQRVAAVLRAHGQGTVTEIYGWIEESFPDDIQGKPSWKNTVGSTLSLHKKLFVAHHQSKKKAIWKLVSEDEEEGEDDEAEKEEEDESEDGGEYNKLERVEEEEKKDEGMGCNGERGALVFPAITWAERLERVLRRHGGEGTVGEIYNWVQEDYSEEIKGKHTWKNTIGATLSLHKNIVKKVGSTGRRTIWQWVEGARRRKNRNGKGKGPATAERKGIAGEGSSSNANGTNPTSREESLAAPSEASCTGEEEEEVEEEEEGDMTDDHSLSCSGDSSSLFSEQGEGQ